MTERTGRVWLDVYHLSSSWHPYCSEITAGVVVEVACGVAFDEGCGDCLVCFDDCEYGQGRWVLHTNYDTDELTAIFLPLFEAMAACAA